MTFTLLLLTRDNVAAKTKDAYQLYDNKYPDNRSATSHLLDTKSHDRENHQIRGAKTKMLNSDETNAYNESKRGIPRHNVPRWDTITQDDYKRHAASVMESLGNSHLEKKGANRERALQGDDDNNGLIYDVSVGNIIKALDRFQSGRSRDSAEDEEDSSGSSGVFIDGQIYINPPGLLTDDNCLGCVGSDGDYLDDDNFALIKEDFDESDVTRRFDKYLVLFYTVDAIATGDLTISEDGIETDIGYNGQVQTVTGTLYSSNGLFVGKYFNVNTKIITPENGVDVRSDSFLSTYMMYSSGRMIGTLQLQGTLSNRVFYSIVGGTGRFAGATGFGEGESRQLDVPLGCDFNGNWPGPAGDVSSNCVVGVSYLTLHEFWEHDYIDYEDQCDF